MSVRTHLTDYQFGLAPMEGVTGLATRLWFSLVGAVKAMSTPFLRATATFPHQRLPPDFAPEHFHHLDSPYRLMPQVMAQNADHFLAAVKYLSPSSPVELNCGCPAPNSYGSGAGSALLINPSQFRNMLREILDQLGPGRLAIKMRLGIEDAEKEFPRLFEVVADLPLYRLTLHGRTRQDRYLGHSRWDMVGWASQQTHIPVFASGDVLSCGTFKQLCETAPRISGVLIGRGALRFPWIFHELLRFQASPHGTFTPETFLTSEELLLALKCLYGLEKIVVLATHYLHASDQTDFFIELCTFIWSAAAQSGSMDRWRICLAKLDEWSMDYMPNTPNEKIERIFLGRLKMFWNYLRSSLPIEFQNPLLLREKTIGSFWTLLQQTIEIWRLQTGDKPHALPLKHQPHLDWIYSGGGKNS